MSVLLPLNKNCIRFCVYPFRHHLRPFYVCKGCAVSLLSHILF
nr:MAG TPA: hypothetical protein [Bacteriophage sp.]